MPDPRDELRVIGVPYVGVTATWYHLNSGTSVRHTDTGAWICLAHKCIQAQRANDCEHVSVAAKYVMAHPEIESGVSPPDPAEAP